MTEPSPPVVAGVSSLLRLIGDLIKRPGRWTRPSDSDLFGDQPLPMLVVHQPRHTDFLVAAAQLLKSSAHGRVPYAYVDAGQASESADASIEPAVLPLVNLLVKGLRRDAFGAGSAIPFTHFALVDFLTRLRAEDNGDLHRQVRASLSKWDKPGTAWSQFAAHPLAAVLDVTLTAGLWLTSIVFKKTAAAWSQHHVPGLRREARWLMRQIYAVPTHSTSFIGFAARLTVDERDSEQPEEVQLLLVHAFLQDLRAAFQRTRWKGLLIRRRGARRAAYTTALVDDISDDNGGGELLRLITAVRNRTGQLDPLLVVATTTDTSSAQAAEAVDANQAAAALTSWRNSLPKRRRRMAADARYLRIRLDDRPPVETDRNAWSTIKLEPARPPWIARKFVIEALVLMLLVAVSVPAISHIWRLRKAGCGPDAAWHNMQAGVAVAPVAIDGKLQCVGYSDSESLIFGTGQRLKDAQTLAFKQNAEAKRIAAANRSRVLMSLVYFAGLTHAAGESDTDDAIAEEIEGLVMRQQMQNNASTSEPLLRIVIANGGSEMKAAPGVSRDFIKELLIRDQTIVAVIGMDRTVAQTEEAITLLGSYGVPIVGTTLTGTGLVDRSRLYFQLVPDNARLAELVFGYRNHLKAIRIVVYHPADDAEDSYITTLIAEIGKAVKNSGQNPQEVVTTMPWRGSPTTLESFCGTHDGSQDLVFFAGREDVFGDFLRAGTKGCHGARLPHILAADTVNRFMADASQRSNVGGAGIPVAYIGLASMVVLAGKTCIEGTPNPAFYQSWLAMNEFCETNRKFRDLHQDQLKKAAPAALWPAERTGLTYDGAGLLVDAVIRSLPDPRTTGDTPQRALVAQAIRDISHNGVTARFAFANSRIANDRNVAILAIGNLADKNAAPTCAYLIGELLDKNQQSDPRTHCPAPQVAIP